MTKIDHNRYQMSWVVAFVILINHLATCYFVYLTYPDNASQHDLLNLLPESFFFISCFSDLDGGFAYHITSCSCWMGDESISSNSKWEGSLMDGILSWPTDGIGWPALLFASTIGVFSFFLRFARASPILLLVFDRCDFTIVGIVTYIWWRARYLNGSIIK